MRRAALGLLVLLALAGPAAAVVWPLPPGDDVIGELIEDRLRGDERPLDLARLHNIGHNEIRAANPDVDPWSPAPGTVLTIPQLHVLPDGPREGIVVNLAERRLYYFASSWPDRDGPVVDTHPVGVGLFDRATPTLQTRVTARLEDPAWYPNAETRAYYAREGRALPARVPPGPENPLGRHALVLADDALLIHGTHRPDGVGLAVSQGCIRLYPESIAWLIGQVPVGTPVRIVDQPVRIGWRDGRLYLDVDPVDDGMPDWPAVQARLIRAVAERPGVVLDVARAEAVWRAAEGVPVMIAAPEGG
ncbi:L,D-transpeptidase family protein [Wenzhouxiangella sp. XN79A]|uniref:L,D-transpeptidase family protein n=1 Tax=Wenzhouxiangella sp. XN79A TaxID=2724193 RepID=UPI00144ADCBC|nr:L,D-transpeptidase family protein [Wenzhouxiangella sp. XN79A]NKI35265.1 L,D-transpeptidase family protein [Wenzhouxiangella sp. XN79A]